MYVHIDIEMLDDEGFTRKSTRMAAIEATKRIKKNGDANKSLSHDEKEATIFKPYVVAITDNTQRRRGRKRKMSDQVTNPLNLLLYVYKWLNLSICLLYLMFHSM